MITQVLYVCGISVPRSSRNTGQAPASARSVQPPSHHQIDTHTLPRHRRGCRGIPARAAVSRPSAAGPAAAASSQSGGVVSGRAPGCRMVGATPNSTHATRPAGDGRDPRQCGTIRRSVSAERPVYRLSYRRRHTPRLALHAATRSFNLAST